MIVNGINDVIGVNGGNGANENIGDPLMQMVIHGLSFIDANSVNVATGNPLVQIAFIGSSAPVA